MPANRDERGRFIKGQSGNPSGRPAIPEAQRELLRELVPQALAVKKQILFDDDAPASLRNAVADSVLDRVYGRPAQDVKADGGSDLAKLDELLKGIDRDAAE